LTIALIAAGDVAAAERGGAAALAWSRDAGDLWNQAGLLTRMVGLDLRAGRLEDAAAHLQEGLQIAARTGNWHELLYGLNHCGQLCFAAGHFTEAVTVWAAGAVLLGYQGLTGAPVDAWGWAEPLREAGRALGPSRFRVAEERGAAMSLATAAEYALMLSAPGSQPSQAAELRVLSVRERELVTLVAEGCTNAQIAAQLYISVRTVGSHLDRIRDKTGCRRRADLTRLALAAGLV